MQTDRRRYLRTVRLHGELAERFGRTFTLAVRHAGEIAAALEVLRPGFKRALLASQADGVGYRLFVDEPACQDAERQLESRIDALRADLPDGAPVDIVPTPLGASGVVRVVIGVVLIVAGIFTGNPGLVLLGIGYLAGGIAQILSKPPSLDDFADQPGTAFGGLENTVQQGHPVPVLYGEAVIGSATIGLSTFAAGFGFRDQKIRILDLLSEGPCEGFPSADPRRDVYFNETPWVDAQGNVAFRNAALHHRPGDVVQEPIAGFAASATTQAIGVQLIFEQPETRTTQASALGEVRINLASLANNRTSKKGGFRGVYLHVDIEVRDDGGTWIHRERFSHAFASSSRRNFTVTVPVAGTGPWHITLTKAVPDSSGAYASDAAWHSVTEVGEVAFSYPFSALAGVELTSNEFSSVPRRNYRYRGRKIRVPSNYDPVARTYAGDWDGTFAPELRYSPNPAWCWLDLLTHPRYGMGSYVQLDDAELWMLYRAAQYCDERVDDGQGGQQPRFTLSVHIRRRREAWSLLTDLGSAFRAVPFWTGAQVGVSQDRPGSELYLFTPANVVDGIFSYSSTPLRRRANRILVRYANPDDFGQPAVAQVDDKAAILRDGPRPREISALYYGTRGEATRLGRWVRETENRNDEAVRFKTGLEGHALMPGEIFATIDPLRGGERTGGRVAGAGDAYVDLDRDVTLQPGSSYQVAVVGPDTIDFRTAPNNAGSLVLSQAPGGGDFRSARVVMDADGDGIFETAREPIAWDGPSKTLTLQPLAGSGTPVAYEVTYPTALFERNVTNAAGTHRRLAVDVAFPDRVRPESVWYLVELSEEPELWKCIGVERVDEGDSYEVSGALYDDAKFAAIEQDLALEDPDPALAPPAVAGAIPAPLGLGGTVELRSLATGLEPVLRLRWADPEAAPGADLIAGYRISYRANNGPITPVPELVVGNEAFLPLGQFGTYEVTVQAQGVLTGKLSAPTPFSFFYESDLIPDLGVKVTGLEVVGGSRVDRWPGDTLRMRFRINDERFAQDLGASPQDAGVLAPVLEGFVYEFRDPDSGALLRSGFISKHQRSFEYGPDANREDGGPRRELLVRVIPRDSLGRRIEAGVQQLAVENPPPPDVATFALTTSLGTVFVRITPGTPRDPDTAGFLVFAGAVPDFPANAASRVAISATPDLNFDAPSTGSLYVRVAEFDRFFDVERIAELDVEALLNVSPSHEVTTSRTVGFDVVSSHLVASSTANSITVQGGGLQVDAHVGQKIAVTAVVDSESNALGTVREVASNTVDTLVLVGDLRESTPLDAGDALDIIDSDIADGAIDSLVVRELTLETVNFMNDLASLIDEAKDDSTRSLFVPGTFPVDDGWTPWVTVEELSTTLLGNVPVWVIMQAFLAIRSFGSSASLNTALVPDGVLRQFGPRLQIRVVRDLGGPSETVVWSSDDVTLSSVGNWPGGAATELDLPGSGLQTYTVQARWAFFLYEEGVADFTNGSTTVAGTGTGWSEFGFGPDVFTPPINHFEVRRLSPLSAWRGLTVPVMPNWPVENLALSSAWPDASSTGSAYQIRHQVPRLTVDVTKTRMLLTEKRL